MKKMSFIYVLRCLSTVNDTKCFQSKFREENGCLATTRRSSKLNSKWQLQNKTEMKVNTGNTQFY